MNEIDKEKIRNRWNSRKSRKFYLIRIYLICFAFLWGFILFLFSILGILKLHITDNLYALITLLFLTLFSDHIITNIRYLLPNYIEALEIKPWWYEYVHTFFIVFYYLFSLFVLIFLEGFDNISVWIWGIIFLHSSYIFVSISHSDQVRYDGPYI